MRPPLTDALRHRERKMASVVSLPEIALVVIRFLHIDPIVGGLNPPSPNFYLE